MLSKNPTFSGACNEGGGCAKPNVTRRQLVLGAASAVAVASLSSKADAFEMTVTNLREYRGALARLSAHFHVALIDIGADWCAICKRIDQEILADAEVQRAMDGIALIKVDVTRMDEGNRELLKYLRAGGPPTLFVVQTVNGREYVGTRSAGSFTAEDLLRRLRPFGT